MFNLLSELDGPILREINKQTSEEIHMLYDSYLGVPRRIWVCNIWGGMPILWMFILLTVV